MTSTILVLATALFSAAAALPFETVHRFRSMPVSAPIFPGQHEYASQDVPDFNHVRWSPPVYYNLIWHDKMWTTYVTWSYEKTPLASGLTWGIECKNVGCTVKAGFVGFRNESVIPMLQTELATPAGTTGDPKNDGKVFCPKDQFMTSMTCKDAACTIIELVCAPVAPGLRAGDGEPQAGVWLHEPRGYCNSREYVNGIQCRNSCKYNFDIYCTKVEERPWW